MIKRYNLFPEMSELFLCFIKTVKHESGSGVVTKQWTGCMSNVSSVGQE